MAYENWLNLGMVPGLPLGEEAFTYIFPETVAPGFFQNHNTFYTIEFVPGPVAIEMDEFASGNSFFPVSAIPGPVSVGMTPFVNVNSYGAFTVEKKLQTIPMFFLENTNQFHAIKVTSIVDMEFLESANQFPPLTTKLFVNAGFFQNQNELFEHEVRAVTRVEMDNTIDVRSNLLLKSGQMHVSPWSKANSTIVAAAHNDMALWTRNSTAAAYIGQGIDKPTESQEFTLHGLVKKHTGSYAAIRMQGTYPARIDARFNLDTGELDSVTGTTFSGLSAFIHETPEEGVFRIGVSAKSDSANRLGSYVSFNTNGVMLDGTDSAGDSAGYIGKFQLEHGRVATEYMETDTTPVSDSGNWFPPLQAVATLKVLDFGFFQNANSFPPAEVAPGPVTRDMAFFQNTNQFFAIEKINFKINMGFFDDPDTFPAVATEVDIDMGFHQNANAFPAFETRRVWRVRPSLFQNASTFPALQVVQRGYVGTSLTHGRNGGSGNNMRVAIPSGAQAGDFALFVFTTDISGVTFTAPNVDTTHLAHSSIGDSDAYCGIYSKQLTSTDISNGWVNFTSTTSAISCSCSVWAGKSNATGAWSSPGSTQTNTFPLPTDSLGTGDFVVVAWLDDDWTTVSSWPTQFTTDRLSGTNGIIGQGGTIASAVALGVTYAGSGQSIIFGNSDTGFVFVIKVV